MFHPTVPHTRNFLSHFVPLWQGKKRHRRVFFAVPYISFVGLSRVVESAAKTTSPVTGFTPTRSRYFCGEGAGEFARSRKAGANWDPKPLARGQRRCTHAGRASPRRFCAGLMRPRAKSTGARSPIVRVGIANKAAVNQRAPRFAMRRPWIAKASSTIALSGVPGSRLLRPSRGPCSIRESSAMRDSITACAPSRTPLRA